MRTSRAPRWIVTKALEERDADGKEPLDPLPRALAGTLRKGISWNNFTGRDSVQSAGGLLLGGKAQRDSEGPRDLLAED